MTTPDRGKEEVDWAEVRRILTIPPIEEQKGAPWDSAACRHMRVWLNDEAHTVTCQNCKKQLDPFWYLQLLASEWKIRHYELLQYQRLHDEIEEHRKEKEAQLAARKNYKARPIKNLQAQEIWDRATTLLGAAPPRIVANGRYWYIGDDEGSGYTAIEYLEGMGSEKAKLHVFNRKDETA
jgi:hypothetical protein